MRTVQLDSTATITDIMSALYDNKTVEISRDHYKTIENSLDKGSYELISNASTTKIRMI